MALPRRGGSARGPGAQGARGGRSTAAGRAPSARRPTAQPRRATAAPRRRPEGRGATRAVSRTGGGAPSPARRSALTGRAAILALVVCALVLSFAYPVRQYVEQQSEISTLAAQNAERRAQVRELERQKQRWQDPAYVRAQARERLHFVLPGETGYVADGRGADADELQRQSGTPPHESTAENQPWYTRLWSTVEGASGGGAAP